MSSDIFAPESDVAALIRAQQFIQSEPDSVHAHFEHALALCRLSQWQQAAAAWQNVVRLEPGNAFAYINMGVVHLEQAQWAFAEQAFRQALYLQPHQPAAHYGLGAACAQQGQLEAARAAWGQTLHLAPDHAEARAALDELNLLAQEDALPPVECVVTSQINLQPPSSTQPPIITPTPAAMQMPAIVQTTAAPQMPAAQQSAHAESPVSLNAFDATLQEEKPATSLREEKPATAATQSQRIKLPQFNGPNLTAIADVVMTAQHTTRPDSAVHDAAEASRESDSIAPTLRLDAKEIRNAHRRMRAASLPLSPRRIAGRALLGTGLACIVGLLVWAMQRPQTSAENTASSPHVTLAALPVTSTAPIKPPDTPAPSAASLSSNTPRASAPDTGQLAAPAQDQTGSRQTITASTHAHAAAPAPYITPDHLAVARHRHIARAVEDAAVSHHTVSRPARVPQARAEAASSADTPRSRQQNATHIRQAATVHQHRSGGNGEEDTFAARPSPAHSVNGDEWTDKLPQ